MLEVENVGPILQKLHTQISYLINFFFCVATSTQKNALTWTLYPMLYVVIDIFACVLMT